MHLPDLEKRTFFTTQLMRWFAQAHRPLPWKGETDPYLIWLSEIILQQTRVEQGLPYFKKFREKFPTVRHLAAAPPDEVMKMWEGLGYYSRARNLHEAARHIAHELNGVFPSNYEDIRSLKGVGDYTAAAIASFAFGLPYAVLDGNVFRVLARFFGIDTPIDTAAGKKVFVQLAQSLLDPSQPGNFNQAIMDFGATQCMPAVPKCTACPLHGPCSALRNNSLDTLPVKSKKLERRQRFFNYMVIRQDDCFFIKKRTGKDIWRGLYEFPMIETEFLPGERQTLTKTEAWKTLFGKTQPRIRRVSLTYKQELTHQRIFATFWEIEVAEAFSPPETSWIKTGQKNLDNFAFPQIISRYFREKLLPLKLL
jgi:A/G-specific adenine glycosylase